MLAIVTVGLPGSGKEVFARAARESGFAIVRMGDSVREYAASQGLHGDAGIGALASSERQAHGPDIWAKRTIEKIAGKKVVIDGTRSMDEVNCFRDQYGQGQVIIVAIATESRTRYERLYKRKRSDAPESFDDFKVREERELGWGAGAVFEHADYTIENNAGYDEYKAKCLEVIKEILAKQ